MADVVVAATYAVAFLIAGVAAVEDLRTHRLRNVYTGALAAVALTGFGLAAVVGPAPFPVRDLAVGVALFCGPWFVLHLISPAGLGFGDVKLTAGLGLLLGWAEPTLAVYALLVAGLLFVVVALAARVSLDEPRPFGPALVAGTAVVLFGFWLLA